MRRTAMMLLVSLILAACVAPALAGDPPVPIEGKLLVTCWDQNWSSSHYYMSGSSDNRVPMGFDCADAALSPLGDQVCYHDGIWDEVEIWNTRFDVWKAGLDGSNALNLTDLAGLGGINCRGKWSPDGSKLSFVHCDPVEGLLPCEAGFYPWIMDADGTDAYQLRPETTSGGVYWSPNGYRLLCNLAGIGNATLDIDGTDVQYIPNVGGVSGWSPDGSKILCNWTPWDEVDGQIGWWRQVGTTNADGSDPQVLVEQFVRCTDICAHITLHGLDPSQSLGICYWSGPTRPVWSPTGDRIALVAAMPFDPLGPLFWFQHEVWMYDLATTDLTKITNDLLDDRVVNWNGNNTLPEDPEVTVDNTTVTFSEVTGEGLTTILRDDDPPELPAGYQFCGEYYEVSTTATAAGPITICMTYEDEDVPGGNEDALCLLHYNEAIPGYEDITISRDPVNNVVCGQVDSLSVFGLAEIEMPVFGGFRQPINPDGSSVWKAGRTIPVKFALYDPLGSLITDAACHLGTSQVSSEILGSVPETAEAVYADAGDSFRYDPDDQQYIYNLSTKGMATGTWMLQVTADGWPGFAATVMIGLR